MSSHSIVVATSIPPALQRDDAGRKIDTEYQKLCIASWLECGMRVLSVNDPDEIPALTSRYPEVTFHAAPRNAQRISGRKTPFIADILLTLAATPDPVIGIVNADIVLEPGPMWREMGVHISGNSIAIARRFDAHSLLHGPLIPYGYGFDCFFLDNAAAAPLAAEARQFAMGLPWWDYWLPLALASKGYDMLAMERPASIHLIHDSTREPVVGTPNWRRLALDFAASLAGERGLASIPEYLAPLRLLCRKLLASADVDFVHSTLDNDIVSLCHAALRVIDGNARPVNLPTHFLPASLREGGSTSGEAIPGTIFARFEVRAAAGRALHKGHMLQAQGKLGAAEHTYRTALAGMPNDAGLLTSLGICLRLQGRVDEAVSVLRKAAANAPSSCEILNGLGMCLVGLNRLDEAILCLEKALVLDPEYGLTYYGLAKVLSLTDRQNEAVARLEAARATRPSFKDADRWLQKLYEEFGPLDKPQTLS